MYFEFAFYQEKRIADCIVCHKCETRVPDAFVLQFKKEQNGNKHLEFNIDIRVDDCKEDPKHIAAYYITMKRTVKQVGQNEVLLPINFRTNYQRQRSTLFPFITDFSKDLVTFTSKRSGSREIPNQVRIHPHS